MDEIKANKTLKRHAPLEQDWRKKVVDRGILSPLFILFFIVLFINGKDGYDLHDAILNIVMNYGS